MDENCTAEQRCKSAPRRKLVLFTPLDLGARASQLSLVDIVHSKPTMYLNRNIVRTEHLPDISALFSFEHVPSTVYVYSMSHVLPTIAG